MNTRREQLRSELSDYEPGQGPGELARILIDIGDSEPAVLQADDEDPVGMLILVLVHLEVQLHPDNGKSLPGLTRFLAFSRKEVLAYLDNGES